MRRNKLIAIFMAIALVFTMTGCSGTSAFPGTTDKETVVINVPSEPTELNPMRMEETVSQSVLIHTMAGFTKLDENDNPVADLAESWEMNEDKTVYTMHLRKDAKWSNGDQVTVNDFYYAWVKEMTPDTGCIYPDFLYNNIKNGEDFYNGKVKESELGLEVIDDFTLKITWSHPMTNGLFLLSQPYYLPVNQKAYESIGDKNYAKEADKMVTNGAYKVTEWVHNDHLTMEKSDTYYNASKINVPKIKMTMVADTGTSLNAFKVGEIDITNIYGDDIEAIKKEDQNAAQSYNDGGSWYLDFNTKDQYLSNKNLRKALAYAIDTQSLLDNVIKDGSVAADGFVSSVISGADGKKYTETRGSLFAYDKDAAVKYLDAALKELSLTKDQLKLTFIQTESTYNQTQAAYLQQQWKEKLGITVELKTLSAQALSDAKKSGEYTFTVGGWGPSENDPLTFLQNYQSKNSVNYSQYSNLEYDALMTSIVQESDANKRQDMLIKAEKILMDDMVVGPLYFTCTTYAISGKVKGIVRTPFQFFNFCNATLN